MAPLVTKSPDTDAIVAWYDVHAMELADGYEGLAAAETHPQLFDLIQASEALSVLDVGAGTGRDAAALADLGHRVTAVEPSPEMLRLARRLHQRNDIHWLSDVLPSLRKVSGNFDLILLSAVWMHVRPEDRASAVDRLAQLLTPRGCIYLTLRIGPGDAERWMWPVSADEIEALARSRNLNCVSLGRQADLLGRNEIVWQPLLLTRQ